MSGQSISHITSTFEPSSTEQRVASSVVEAVAAIGRALGPLEIRWYVFGAQAAILRGARRLSADLDITIAADASRLGPVLEALEREGVRMRVVVDEAFIQATRVLPMIHEPTQLPVDAVLAGPGFEDRFFARATNVVVDGTSIPLPRTEDLLVMKVLAGRPKDWEDVVDVLRCNELDHEAVRRDLCELEKLLDQSDLIRSFDTLAARAHRR